jgi:hypothetical protein
LTKISGWKVGFEVAVEVVKDVKAALASAAIVVRRNAEEASLAVRSRNAHLVLVYEYN